MSLITSIMNVGKPEIKNTETTVPKLDKKQAKEFMNTVHQQYKHTPDWEVLELEEFQTVFEYGRMLTGGSRFDVIKDICKPIVTGDMASNAWCYTKGNYDVYQNNIGKDSFPIALKAHGKSIRPYPVMGRLINIRSDMMKELDIINCNGVLFRRKKVEIAFLRRRFKRAENYGFYLDSEEVWCTRAWMYVGKNTHWSSLIDSGYYYSPCGLYYPKRRGIEGHQPYYLFKAQEINK